MQAVGLQHRLCPHPTCQEVPAVSCCCSSCLPPLPPALLPPRRLTLAVMSSCLLRPSMPWVCRRSDSCCWCSDSTEASATAACSGAPPAATPAGTAAPGAAVGRLTSSKRSSVRMPELLRNSAAESTCRPGCCCPPAVDMLAAGSKRSRCRSLCLWTSSSRRCVAPEAVSAAATSHQLPSPPPPRLPPPPQRLAAAGLSSAACSRWARSSSRRSWLNTCRAGRGEEVTHRGIG